MVFQMLCCILQGRCSLDDSSTAFSFIGCAEDMGHKLSIS